MPETAGDEGGKLLNRIIEKILDIFYPERCAVCDGVLPAGQRFLCRDCTDKVRYVGENYCFRCGKPVEEEEEYCADCQDRKTTFQYGRSVFLYDRWMRDSISRFKYHGRQEYAAFYANAMYQQYHAWITGLAPDALLPVPVHKERYRKRGYNQAELVAAKLSELCGVPLVTDYLIRTKNTLPQKELSDRERLVNLCHAFSVRTAPRELYKSLKCVILIDDIYTTGSTMEACAQVLSRHGVDRIYFLCISTGQGI